MHLSFALGELGLRMEEFYSMPWSEYVIKCFAWARMERKSWEKFRLPSYYAAVGPHLNPNSLPLTIEKFFPLGNEGGAKKRRASQWAIDLANQRMKEWQESQAKIKRT